MMYSLQFKLKTPTCEHKYVNCHQDLITCTFVCMCCIEVPGNVIHRMVDWTQDKKKQKWHVKKNKIF